MKLKGLRDWLGLERNILIMLLVILLFSMGEELWSKFLPKYLEFLGASAWIIAIYGTLRDFLDAVYQYPGGWLADHLGRKSALAVFILLSIVGYGIYLISPSWHWILIGTLFVMAWSSLALPATFAIIGDNLPKEKRAIGFGVQSILKRIPIIIAPPIGGWLIMTLGFVMGIKVGLIATIFLAILALIIVSRYYVKHIPSIPDTSGFRKTWGEIDDRLKKLLVSDIFTRLAEGIPDVFIVLYVVNILKTSIVSFGWLISIQMLSATLVYIPISKLSDRMNRKPFILLTFFIFALFPLILAFSTNIFWLTLAFIVAGLREIGEPARKALIVDLAKESIRGRSIGVYYLFRGLAVFPASLIGGWLWIHNPHWPFYIAFIAGMIGVVIFVRAGLGSLAQVAKAER